MAKIFLCGKLFKSSQWPLIKARMLCPLVQVKVILVNGKLSMAERAVQVNASCQRQGKSMQVVNAWQVVQGKLSKSRLLVSGKVSGKSVSGKSVNGKSVNSEWSKSRPPQSTSSRSGNMTETDISG